MNKFKVKYSFYIVLLIAFVIVLALGGIALNVYNIIYYLNDGFFKILTYSLITLGCVVILIMAIFILANSNYTVKKDKLVCRFGLIGYTYKISDVIAITLFKEKNKLVVYFENNKYTVLLLPFEIYDSFINCIKGENPMIIYNEK